MTTTFQSQTFKVARFCVRKRPDEKDVPAERRRTSMHRGNPRTSQIPACPDVVRVLGEIAGKPEDLGDREQGNGSEAVSTDKTREAPMASPRSSPAPDSPPLSIQLPPYPSAGDKGAASASFGRKRAPSQAPATDMIISSPLPMCSSQTSSHMCSTANVRSPKL